ncbi:palmitoyl-monogalactosyldiacylglycerol delta-7 desaturase, chloroplastic-like [Cucurbita pepo subsp. pepo]|uniref:palmitoyl-monogalactosyldiacylglycerol delta-7 desaturase, chloroplastic-like n=1 Tax=Cucurbita pepo subsp. pepo TaxID=3664 RepID=UPI000C9D7A0A|nr:palmitoyl-monogalactosyldiacylglycerol delta-7 desaturase, chloroplastic-like [Cucurbita pepo subsp. pepo]
MGTSKQESKHMAKPEMPFCSRKWTNREKLVTVTFSIIHILCIFAPFQFTWNAFWVAVALYVISGLFGITISYHRNLSHRSFNLPKWLEYLFAYCGTHAFQGDPIDWVSTHRCHHQNADTERDPHSPTQGFWFSYLIWFLDSITLTNKVCPEYFIDRKDTKKGVFTLVLKYGRPNNVSDLEKQTFYRFIHDTYILHPIALAILLYFVGGTPFVIWGMCVRIVMLFHTTFMVNSICHSWGKQQWNTKDLSRNNWWLSLISFGEAWHNNHHAFEYSARIGVEWWQLDIGWYVILFLQTIGVATDVKQPSPTHKQRLAMDKPKEGVSESLK